MFVTDTPHWIDSTPKQLQENGILNCLFRFQHTKPLAVAQIKVQQSGLIVKLERPTRALTPGQYAVFYSGQECLGCARIIQNQNIDQQDYKTRSSFPSFR